MPTDWIELLWNATAVSVGGLLFAMGGLRFRRWAVEGRAGIPRFPGQIETILLWLLYSGGLAIVIVLIKQVVRRL